MPHFMGLNQLGCPLHLLIFILCVNKNGRTKDKLKSASLAGKSGVATCSNYIIHLKLLMRLLLELKLKLCLVRMVSFLK